MQRSWRIGNRTKSCRESKGHINRDIGGNSEKTYRDETKGLIVDMSLRHFGRIEDEMQTHEQRA
jgi:hypothetical protein